MSPGPGHRPPAALYALLALTVLCALWVPRFATAGNALNLLRVASVLAIAGCGQAVVIMVAGIDFSTGASVALVSVATVMLLQWIGPLPALLLGAVAAVAVGAANGWLIGRLRLPALIATLGMSFMVGGMAAWLVGGMPLDPTPPEAFYWLGRGRLYGVPVPILVAIIACLLLQLLLAHTTLGRRWMLIGSNPRAARLAGLPVTRDVALAYAVCGLYTAVAGAVLTSRIASGQPQLFPGLPFETIAACAVGGASLAGGRTRTIHVVIGVLIVATLNNAVVLLNLPAALQQLLIALVIIGAVIIRQPGAWRLRSPGSRSRGHAA